MKTYYTVYKITNMIDEKIYIGVHRTKNLDDNYMGSGKYIKRAQEKHGIENFNKEYLAIFDNPEEMFDMESELVNEDFVNDGMTYNLKEGGEGGRSHLNDGSLEHIERCIRAGRASNQDEALKAQKWLRENDPEWVEKKSGNLSKALIKRFETENGTFKGRKHSNETRKKMSESSIGTGKGEKNSQFGTMWIYSLEEKKSKKIKKDEFPEYEVLGWLKGRKIKF